ncbi:hypothetical protein AXK58_03740 [Tsukamurella tyrosinosolvens]|nr:hypothetical protein AXK58_03740 [Tsukamurella tyrosinosolvens]
MRKESFPTSWPWNAAAATIPRKQRAGITSIGRTWTRSRSSTRRAMIAATSYGRIVKSPRSRPKATAAGNVKNAKTIVR